MASAYGDIESSKRAFLALLSYFGEEERSDIGPQKFLRTLSLFCGNFDAAVEQAIAVETQEVRETRLTCGPRYPTRIQRPETSRKAGPISVMGSILADIQFRTKNIQSSGGRNLRKGRNSGSWKRKTVVVGHSCRMTSRKTCIACFVSFNVSRMV
jgi:hypothetical protein